MNQQWRNKQEFGWICWLFYKTVMDKTNKHSLNRSQKQLIETPDPQFNRGFQYTVPFDRYLTNLSIVYHVEMLVIQCFWTIRFQSQLWKNIIVCNTITIDSNGYLHSIHKTNRIEQWNLFSFTSTLFMLVQYNDFMRLSSTIQFIHLIVSIHISILNIESSSIVSVWIFDFS